jgi:hypothetical protein
MKQEKEKEKENIQSQSTQGPPPPAAPSHAKWKTGKSADEVRTFYLVYIYYQNKFDILARVDSRRNAPPSCTSICL